MRTAPHRPGRRRLLAGALAAALLLPVAGCGLATSSSFTPGGKLAGPLADVERLDGAGISVGSKNFSEQLLLGKMAIVLLKSAGADPTDLTNIPGSASARQAMLENQTDIQWEYTGTAWLTYLGHTKPIPDEQKQYEAVAREDEKKYGLVWLEPAPMNNTYGFATTQKVADELGVEKLSDLQDVPVDQRTFCIESEFANRDDGLEPMLETYDVPLGDEVPRDNLKQLDTGAIYAATAGGTCNFGEVFTTDGRIKALDLKVLEDDRKFFPAYNVSVVIREETIEEYPQLRDLFAPVAAKLTDETLIELNSQIDVDGREPANVAFDWLKSEGFIR